MAPSLHSASGGRICVRQTAVLHHCSGAVVCGFADAPPAAPLAAIALPPAPPIRSARTATAICIASCFHGSHSRAALP